MDQRCNVRNPIQHNVVVDCPGLGLTPANTGDVSLSGMYIHANGLTFPLGAPVFIAFDSSPGAPHDGLGLDAMVVRRTASGVGLMFLDSELHIVNALRSVQSKTPIVAQASRPDVARQR